MSRSICCVNIAEPNRDEADGGKRDRLKAIVAETDTHICDRVDFLSPFGKNADHVAEGHRKPGFSMICVSVDAIVQGRLSIASGRNVNSAHTWPIAGIGGTRLDPNKKGCGW